METTGETQALVGERLRPTIETVMRRAHAEFQRRHNVENLTEGEIERDGDEFISIVLEQFNVVLSQKDPECSSADLLNCYAVMNMSAK